MHLLDKCSPGLDGLDGLNPDDLDTMGPGAVTSSHIPVALGDGGGDGHVPVFAVHVVGTGTGVITEPDTEVLNLKRFLFADFFNADDLSGGLFEFPQLTQKVPEPVKCNEN